MRATAFNSEDSMSNITNNIPQASHRDKKITMGNMQSDNKQYIYLIN